MEAEHLMAFILDCHIPPDNRICPCLATLSFNKASLSGDFFVQVLQSHAPLPGISWEHGRLRSIEVLSGDIGDHHHMACEDIEQACGGDLIFHFTQEFTCWATRLII